MVWKGIEGAGRGGEGGFGCMGRGSMGLDITHRGSAKCAGSVLTPVFAYVTADFLAITQWNAVRH